MKFEIGEFVEVTDPMDEDIDEFKGEVGKVVLVPKVEGGFYHVEFDDGVVQEFFEEEISSVAEMQEDFPF